MVRAATNRDRVYRSLLNLEVGKSFTKDQMSKKVTLIRRQSVGKDSNRTDSSVRNHLHNMCQHGLLQKIPGSDRYVPTEKLAKAVERARLEVPDNASSRVTGRCFDRMLGRVRNITKRELCTVIEEKDEQINELQQQWQDHKCDIQGVVPPPAGLDVAMDVDFDVAGPSGTTNVGPSTTFCGSQSRRSPTPLSRAPTELVLSPVTPVRKGPSGFLPTPPDTEEVRRVGSFSQPLGGRQSPGPGEETFASFSFLPSGSQGEASSATTLTSGSGPVEAAAFARIRLKLQEEEAVLRAAGTHEHQRHLQREAELQKEVERMTQEQTNLKTEMEQCQHELERFEAAHLEQTQQYEALQEREKELIAGSAELQGRMARLVHANAEILTIANVQNAARVHELDAAHETTRQLLDTLAVVKDQVKQGMSALFGNVSGAIQSATARAGF